MTGGLMQLVAYGAQDVYLTGSPMITFFKAVYRRHTNFAMESVEQTFNGVPDFERNISCLISRHGDLISGVYLQATLPAVSGVETANAAERWSENVGHHLIKSIELDIGGQVIDKHYGDWLDIWAQLTVPAEKNIGYYEMIGQDPTGPMGAPGRAQRDEFDAIRISNKTVYIPLQFWFCRNIGLALPLIALQFHEVKIHMKLASKLELMRTTNKTIVVGEGLSNVKLWIDYIYLDEDERRKFTQVAHEYLIEQLQVVEKKVTSGLYRDQPKYVDIDLDFNHPVKELIWTVQNIQAMEDLDRQYSNFTSVRANRPQLANPPDELEDFTPLYGVQFNSNPPANLNLRPNQNDDSIHRLGMLKREDHILAFTNHSCVVPPGSLNPVISAQLFLNGHQRFKEMSGNYFNLYQCNKHHTSVPISPGINVYSFALKPEEHQPSGSCNFSRIDNAKLTIAISMFTSQADIDSYPGVISGTSQTFDSNKCMVKVYAINYNVLRIMSGMGGLAYVN